MHRVFLSNIIFIYWTDIINLIKLLFSRDLTIYLIGLIDNVVKYKKLIMKNFILIIVSLSFLSSCSNDKDFFLTEGNALLSCGGKSRIIENDKEEIINTEVKDLRDGIGKYVEFTVVETDKKGGKYRIINCFPSEEPQDSIIKTVKTNYKLSN